MALQVWLPLNGNIKNQGLSGVAVSLQNGTATYNSSGKIGECFNNCSAGSNITIPCEFLSDQLTITFWVKPNSPNAWMDLFSIGQYASRMETNTTTGDMYYSFCDDTNYGLTAQSQQLFSLTNGVWHHIAYSVNGTNVKVYHNGTLINTIAQAHPLSIAMGNNKTIYIGRRRSIESSHYEGYFNDFRIYDNALSDREIHEISKGIVLHFPLNDIYYTRSINKYKGDTAAGKCSHGSFTCTKLADERGYNYSLQYTGNGNNNWYSIGFPTISFEVGKTYDYSCKVRCNSANFGMQLRASRCCNDWSTNMVTVSNADGKWHEYHVRQTMTGTTFLRSGTTDKPNTAPELEFYTQSLSTNGTVYKGSFDIKDVQVCEVSDNSSVEFTDGAFFNAPANCAGYQYIAATSSGYEPILSKDSPRYDGSYLIENLRCISIQNALGGHEVDEFTISLWVMQIEGGAYSTFLSSNGYGGNGLWLGFNVESCGQWAFRGSYSPNYARSGDGNLSLNTWYHFAYRFSKGTVTWFLNGQKKNSTTYSGSTTMNMGAYLYLGNVTNTSQWDTTFKGKFSDFRMYATALSDKDIKELYNAPISITDKGAIMTQGEFKEV